MSKTKADLQIEIQDLKKKLEENKSNNNYSVSDNQIHVKNEIIWDSASIEVMNNVSKALLNMTELFKKQEIHLDAMIKLDGVSGVSVSGCELKNEQLTSSNPLDFNYWKNLNK